MAFQPAQEVIGVSCEYRVAEVLKEGLAITLPLDAKPSTQMPRNNFSSMILGTPPVELPISAFRGSGDSTSASEQISGANNQQLFQAGHFPALHDGPPHQQVNSNWLQNSGQSSNSDTNTYRESPALHTSSPSMIKNQQLISRVPYFSHKEQRRMPSNISIYFNTTTASSYNAISNAFQSTTSYADESLEAAASNPRPGING
ncbi:hypothetical protein HOY82DRAFT_670728 [Tuber indicum]|nr:hypothetical protein HOY82DRAFT_670728 [Tuber indicum]